MNTTRETYSTQLEDKACCIVGAECEMHCGCGNENDNSDTRGSERKIGARILQCNRFLYRHISISLKWSSHVRWNSFSCPRFYLLSVCLTKTSVTHRIVG
jgi:hypothetical protein